MEPASARARSQVRGDIRGEIQIVHCVHCVDVLDVAHDRSAPRTHPRGWKPDVRYIPGSENRSHSSTLGIKLRRFCDGTRFRDVF